MLVRDMSTNHLIAGFVLGLIPGISADLEVFKAWKSFDEATKFDWKIAIIRWLSYGTLGAVLALSAGYANITVPK